MREFAVAVAVAGVFAPHIASADISASGYGNEDDFGATIKYQSDSGFYVKGDATKRKRTVLVDAARIDEFYNNLESRAGNLSSARIDPGPDDYWVYHFNPVERQVPNRPPSVDGPRAERRYVCDRTQHQLGMGNVGLQHLWTTAWYDTYWLDTTEEGATFIEENREQCLSGSTEIDNIVSGPNPHPNETPGSWGLIEVPSTVGPWDLIPDFGINGQGPFDLLPSGEVPLPPSLIEVSPTFVDQEIDITSRYLELELGYAFPIGNEWNLSFGGGISLENSDYELGDREILTLSNEAMIGHAYDDIKDEMERRNIKDERDREAYFFTSDVSYRPLEWLGVNAGARYSYDGDEHYSGYIETEFKPFKKADVSIALGYRAVEWSDDVNSLDYIDDPDDSPFYLNLNYTF